MKKVTIIGAGIAGMTAGIYLQMSGFDTEIYEMHSIAGGFCTSWKRKGYLFEGGMHWLTGSSDGNSINQMWRETGALAENNPIHLRDPFWTYYDKNGQALHLYRDVKKLRAQLLEASPCDEKAIETLCADIKQFIGFAMPVTDIRGLKTKSKSQPSGIGSIIKMMPALSGMMRLSKLSVLEYLSMFQSDAIKKLFCCVVPLEYSAVAFVMTLSTLSAGDGGYAEGGSLRMAQNMINRYKSLGGKVHYNARVQKVIVSDNHVTGIIVNDEKIPSDAVIAASDTLTAVDQLFDTPLDEKWVAEMKKHTDPQTCIFCSFGVDADLSGLPESISFELDTPFLYADALSTDLLPLYNYASYGYAPNGKTAITCALIGNSYDFWAAAKQDGTYEQKKEQLAQRLMEAYEEYLPQLKGKFEVWDIATPLTFERYCGSFQGSWMSIMGKGSPQKSYPAKSGRISGLYFAGQRLMMPGGMPVAVMTGRQAAQHVCKDNDAVFCNTSD